MVREGITNWPSPLLGKLRATPVSVFVTVMVTLGTAAPLGSVTVPTMVASCAKADNAHMVRKTRVMIARRAKLRRLVVGPRISAYVGERDFICQPPNCN